MHPSLVKHPLSAHRPSPFSIRAAILLVLVGFAVAAVRAADRAERRAWTVDGVAREALVHRPTNAATEPAPLVFVFHGHGGSMQNAAASFALHTHWPQAIVVYPQGVNTPGRLTDPEGKKRGWQHSAGEQNDRDIRFFDTMLTELRRECRVDEQRIYATGHSNGGAFTYLLWAARGDVFAAVAPSAAVATRSTQPKLKPKPVMHLAGQKDELVKFTWQQETIAVLRRLNDCGEGRAWDDACTLYPSAHGTPVVTLIHPGGHAFPRSAPPLIVKFFQAHAKR